MTRTAKLKMALRVILAGLMVWIGVKHFTHPEPFVAIVPKALPEPLLLVHVSGFFEIAGGVGLLAPWMRLRRAAAWGLIALYVAVFPANINMAMNEIPMDGQKLPALLLWLRLPFQAIFIAWAWWCTKPERETGDAQ